MHPGRDVLQPVGLVLALLMTAGGCEGDPVVLGADLCAAAECGAVLSIPSRRCADGTVGGFTGRCLRDEAITVCHWEIADCPPPPPCAPAECGPFPSAHAATSSIPIECRRSADGVCRWTFEEPARCEPSDCGPAPEGAASVLCFDGTVGGFTGACVVGPGGDCVWERIECAGPPTGMALDADCTLDECGELPETTREACADGTRAGLLERCIRREDGTCRWQVQTCPPAVECASNADCTPDAFCDLGLARCDATRRGICVVRPVCPSVSPSDESSRVCGCDGRTYASACEAHAAGVSVAGEGACR